MYKSPIEIIQGELQTEMDGAILKAVRQVGINVDKDELLHALAYDRGQYQLGFRDGKAKAIDELVRCKDCKFQKVEFGWNGKRYKVCINFDMPMDDEDFCSWGERRENGEIH